ncbi:hypothetical protein K461DRAFT_298127 [Myriangium duriaei CBS 260.36]|uniref:Uncharacterized protein n=1 Tax=Myriangium duriaei CBS 260.36 TaxID=1168546 RepID=A0A9P4IUE2_9PEZI|nr:hypothetical protein K461DRAFT_298127 [Myriangium duriaei CBS 260.36]
MTRFTHLLEAISSLISPMIGFVFFVVAVRFLMSSSNSGSVIVAPSTTLIGPRPLATICHVVLVYYRAKWAIAHESELDGDPRGQGWSILNFLVVPGNTNKLTAALDKNMVFEVKPERLNAIKRICPILPKPLSSSGSEMLELVASATEPLPIAKNIEFMFNEILCEWAYVIDLDANRFDIYSPAGTPSADRNPHIDRLARTLGKPVPAIIATYSLDELPSAREFLADTCHT